MAIVLLWAIGVLYGVATVTAALVGADPYDMAAPVYTADIQITSLNVKDYCKDWEDPKVYVEID